MFWNKARWICSSSSGVGDRMRREGLVHHGIELRFNRRGHRIDMHELTGGRAITVYGQHEVVKDLIAARLESGGQILFDAESVGDRRFRGRLARASGSATAASACEIACDYIGGCDGFHGVCRPSIPAGALRIATRRSIRSAGSASWPKLRPRRHELIYAHHERGFALLSMRSPRISRLYLQCRPDEDLAAMAGRSYLGRTAAAASRPPRASASTRGPILQKGVTAMRSFVAEPMQYGRLFLAGDAAHIVPPTGAKGLNLAAADVRILAHALACALSHRLRQPARPLLGNLPSPRLARPALLLVDDFHAAPLRGRLRSTIGRQLAELDQVTTSRAAATSPRRELHRPALRTPGRNL